MVAAGEGLQWDQNGVVFEQHRDTGGSLDLGLAGAARDPFPAYAGAVEPVDELDPAIAAAAVDQLSESGGAPA